MKYVALISCFAASYTSATLSMQELPNSSSLLDIVYHVKTTQPMEHASVADALLFYLQRSGKVTNAKLSHLLSDHAGLQVTVHDFKKPNIQVSFDPITPEINPQKRWFELNEFIHLLSLAKNTVMHPHYNPAIQPIIKGSSLLYAWCAEHVPETTYMICYNSLLKYTPTQSNLLNILEHEKHCLDAQCTFEKTLREILFDNQRNISIAGSVNTKLIVKRKFLELYCPLFFNMLFGDDIENEYDEIMVGYIAPYIANYFCSPSPREDVHDRPLCAGLTEQLQENELDIALQAKTFATIYNDPYNKDHMIQFIREFLFL